MLFLDPPKDFNPTLEAAGCYCEFEKKILLLKRNPLKIQGNTWCLPGGKVEDNESPLQAVIREVNEEVGILLKEEELEEIDKLYVRRNSLDYIFYRFRKEFLKCPLVMLKEDEHIEYGWFALEQAMKLPLIYAGTEALLSYQKYLNEKCVRN